MGDIKKIIKHLTDDDISSVSYEEESLLHRLSSSSVTHPFYRLILIIVAIIAGIAITVTSSIGIILDGLLDGGQFTSNAEGVLRVEQPLGREYIMYLFNPSDYWADTGIELRDNDRIKINVSGAYHKCVGNMLSDAEFNNPSPKYTLLKGDGLEFQYRIGNTKDTLYWNKQCGSMFKKVKGNGTLQLKINDTFLENDNALYNRDSIRFNTIPDYLKKNNQPDGRWIPNDILIKDTIDKYDQVVPSPAGYYKTMLYNNNFGQLLVCAEIEHPLRGGHLNPLMPLRTLDIMTGSFFADNDNPALFHIACILSLLVFMLVYVPWMALILLLYFAIILVVPLCVIYLIHCRQSTIHSNTKAKCKE